MPYPALTRRSARSPRRRLAAGACVFVAASLAGCAAPAAKAPTPPPIRLAVERNLGTPLTGPWLPGSSGWSLALAVAPASGAADPSDTTDVVETTAGPLFVARARFGVSAAQPPAELPLVATSATLVADASRANPVRFVPLAARAARVGPALAPDDARVVWLGAVDGLVAPGTTTGLVARGATSTAPAVALEFHIDADGAPAWALAAATDNGVEDRLLLGAPPGSAAPLTLWIPSSLGGLLPTVVIEVALDAAPEGTDPAPPGALPLAKTAPAVDVAVSSALAAVLGDRPRAALCLLADELDVDVLLDVALIADDPFLASVSAAADLDGEAPLDSADLAFRFERGTLLALAELRGDGLLPPALDAVLLRHAGELGRLPSALLDALRASPDRAALAARLVAENRLLLEDPDPAARRRALAWLEVRGAAPEGFNPLADNAERRAALAADAERRAAAAAAREADE